MGSAATGEQQVAIITGGTVTARCCNGPTTADAYDRAVSARGSRPTFMPEATVSPFAVDVRKKDKRLLLLSIYLESQVSSYNAM